MRQKIRALTQLPVLKQILWFLDSYYFPAAYALLAFLSSLFGLEIAYFAITAVLVVFVSVFARDSKAMLPMVFLAVYGVSWVHTPQPPFSSQFFYSRAVQIYFLVLGVLLVACLMFRFIVFPQDKNFFKESKLRLGIVLMTAAFSSERRCFFRVIP